MRQFLSILSLLSCVLATSAAEPGMLVVVGGGTVPREALRQLVESGGGKKARVVIVPFASEEKTPADSLVEMFKPFGVRSIEVLTETNRVSSQAALKQATAIWFRGGSQTRLMHFLNELGLAEVIQKRHAQGIAVGGTSAGAAVMSRTMIASNGDTPDAPPKISEGLGLWPEVMVDQHFTQRKREPRLRRAVKLHPERPGVGIDEDTAAVVRGKKFETVGSGQIKVIDGRSDKDDPLVTILSAGQKHSISAKAKIGKR